MELKNAEEILALVASAYSGVKVEFLTKPEHVETFVFIRPNSSPSFQHWVELYTVLYRDGLPLQSCSEGFATPQDALDRLCSAVLPFSDQIGVVAPHFHEYLDKMFAASACDTCAGAFARVREDLH